ncbi:hypothetical protein [Roseisolibacter sp. H3M3-2]|uniref:hypothetical protein n=1 Tax=Roseisolibacter sp. H3M3-2 TaxID=3031323 RepID=UPI0023DABD4D|nr:hypothetical protein [Roseisolibacter sp. H3M3-2]MDF1504543.1 hypothetical protein [Roseisolibacter sp. H3M3-2]
MACVLAPAVGPAACRNPGDPLGPERFYTVRAPAAGVRSAPAGSVLADPLEVVVTDSLGVPKRGVVVRFRVVSGRGGAVLDSLVPTDAGGVAVTRVRLGAERDTVVVLGAIPGREEVGARFVLVGTAAARIDALRPAAAVGGDTIEVVGAGLARPGVPPVVLVGASRARVVGVQGDTVLRVVVPPCVAAGAAPVTVQAGAVATAPASLGIGESSRPLALQQLEATTVAGADAAGCVWLPGDGARYLLFPQLASTEDRSPARPFALAHDFVAAADPAAAVESAPPAGTTPAHAAFTRVLRAAEWRLAREGIAAESEALAREARVRRPTAAGDLAPLSGNLVPEPPAVGSERTFRVLSRLDGSAYANAASRLRYAGQSVLIYEDRAAPEPVTDAAVQRLGDLLDRTLHPLDVETFGAESDVDGNGRVIVLLTPIVNGLTTREQCGNEGFVRGFFFGADLGTRNQNSNRAEILYALVPDAAGTRSCPHTTSDVMRALPSTFMHEFQHMISFNQHVLVRRGVEEITWLNEGLSHMAEEIGGRLFERRYPPPLNRPFSAQILPDSAIPFYRGDIDNALLYLASPSATSLSAFQELGTLEERGASWLFLRWLVAQRGESILARLVQSPRTGRANVEEVAGEPFPALFADFVVALSADSVIGLPRTRVPARYRFGATSLRRLLTQALNRDSRWPIPVRFGPVGGTALSATLVPGSWAAFDVSVPRGRPGALRLTTADGAPFGAGAEAQLGILRLSP